MIYLECNPDKALISALGVSNKEIKHAFSKGNVCNQLAKHKNVKGVVDEDPASPQPSYVGKLKLHSHQQGIKFWHDDKNQNRLIMLCPRLEEWILKASQEAGINIQDYGLPNNANQIHHIINIRIENLKNLIKGMKDKSKMLKALEGLIRGTL
jgi:hypothetical protein